MNSQANINSTVVNSRYYPVDNYDTNGESLLFSCDDLDKSLNDPNSIQQSKSNDNNGEKSALIESPTINTSMLTSSSSPNSYGNNTSSSFENLYLPINANSNEIGLGSSRSVIQKSTNYESQPAINRSNRPQPTTTTTADQCSASTSNSTSQIADSSPLSNSVLSMSNSISSTLASHVMLNQSDEVDQPQRNRFGSKSLRMSNNRLTSFYNSLTPTYQSKLNQFRRIFRGTPVDTDRLLVDYSCALNKNSNGFLLQGRMYITETWVCFHSKILFEQKIFLSVKEIVSITKAKTARFIPNAIQILYSKHRERFFFTSFGSRERTYAILCKIWENNHNYQMTKHTLDTNQNMNMDHVFRQIRDICENDTMALVDGEDSDAEADDLIADPYRIRTYSDSSTSSHHTSSMANSWQSTKAIDMPMSKLATMDGDNLLADKAGHLRVPSFSDPDRRLHRRKHIALLSPPVANSTDIPPPSSNIVKIKKKRNRKRRTLESNGQEGVYDSSLPNPLSSSSSSSYDGSNPLASGDSRFDDSAVTCCDAHDHPGQSYVDLEIPLNVNALFQCILSDSEFFHRLSESRGTFNMVQSEWPKVEKWGVDANVSRTITYTLTLKHKVGPRTCSVVEEQTLLVSQCEPNARYVVDAKVVNHAVPLCTCFHVVSRYCLLRVNRMTSRLFVCSHVVQEKPLFFGAKSLIEGSCRSGLSDFFDCLTTQLMESTSKFSTDERLTGGYLACKSNSSHPAANSLFYNSFGYSKPRDIKSTNKKSQPIATVVGAVAANHKSPDLNLVDQNRPNSADCRYSAVYRRLSTTASMFGSTELAHVFTRPDRAWLLLVLISLLLCLCLSMVYNRLLALEKIAEQFSPSNRDHIDSASANRMINHFYSVSNDRPMADSKSDHVIIQDASDQRIRDSRIVTLSKVKLIKELTMALSTSLGRMQDMLKEVHNTVDMIDKASFASFQHHYPSDVTDDSPTDILQSTVAVKG